MLTQLLLWAGWLADSGAVEVTCRCHRGIAAFFWCGHRRFGGSDDDYHDAATVLFFLLCCQAISTSM